MKKNLWIWILVVIVVVAGLVFLTRNGDTSQVGEVMQLDGVKVTIVSEGTGPESQNGDNVSMNYTGRLTDGTVFDSNVDPAFNHVEPFTFTLGAGQVIRGWDVGVLGMKQGEKRTLEIQPDYAYGERGAGNIIPPNATLVFDVELLEIK